MAKRFYPTATPDFKGRKRTYFSFGKNACLAATSRAYLLRNKLLLLDDFPILGGKPGLGEQDMLSLVALLEKDGHKILVVLVRTPSLRHDLTQILKLF